MARTNTKATANTDTAEGGDAEQTAKSTMTLKLVGADTYHCHAVKVDAIQRNEIIEVPAEVGNALLDDTYRDGLNNEHSYFIETSPEEEAASARRAARRSAAKPVEADDEE